MESLEDVVERLPISTRAELSRLVLAGGPVRAGGRVRAGADAGAAGASGMAVSTSPAPEDQAPASIRYHLLNLLHQREPLRVAEVVQALLDLDPDLAAAALVELVRDGRITHAALARSFSEKLPIEVFALPEEEDVARLQHVLRGHHDPLVRVTAAERLGGIESQEALLVLVQGTEDPSDDVVTAALEAIHRLHPSFAISMARKTLSNPTEAGCRAAAEFLGRQGQDGFTRLLDAVVSHVGDQSESAAVALARWMPEETLATCTSMANSSNPRERAGAVTVLRKIAESEAARRGLQASGGMERAVALLDRLAGDGAGEILFPAIGALATLDAPSWRSHLERMLTAPHARTRLSALKILRQFGGKEDFVRIVPHLKDSLDEIRIAAIDLLVELAPSRRAWIDRLLPMLEDGDWQVRQEAVRVLGDHGERGEVETLVGKFRDEDEDVRMTALSGAVRLAPERRSEFALSLLDDPDEKVAREAVVLLQGNESVERVAELALGKLKGAKGESGTVLLDVIQETAPDRLAEAVETALQSRSPSARRRAVEMLSVQHAIDHLPTLRRLFRDRDYRVRLAALDGLVRLAPGQRIAAALDALSDPDDEMRAAGIGLLAGEEDPLLVDPLLPLARDEYSSVRLEAITALAKFDDPRVFSELVSSLNDVEEEVRMRAQELLQGQRGPVPVLSRFAREGDGEVLWARVRARVDGVNRWACRIGQELLGVPIVVHQYRQSIGRTWRNRRARLVEIEVTDTPVTSGHPHGVEIMRAIALHEIGHHLCDYGARGFSATRGIARSEGLGEIYDILLDERLERILRARRPEWGRTFDRLASYVFAQTEHEVSLRAYAGLVGREPEEAREAIGRGELPGRLVQPVEEGSEGTVVLRDADLLAIPGAIPPLAAFLSCLRCGFDPNLHPDRRIAEAVSAVPGNLKDLAHGDLLQVARRIGDRIGRSEQHKRDFDRFRRAKHAVRELLRQWSKALDRMAEVGQLPDWMKKGAPGIRSRPFRMRPGPPLPTPGAGWIDLGPAVDFAPLRHQVALPQDPGRQAALVASVRRHVRVLRPYLERLGRRIVEEYASRRGSRLDLAQARRAASLRRPNLLVSSREELQSNAYLGILIDRSGSMAGAKLERAKAFAALVAESAKGLRGLEGHVNAFDDDTFYFLGDFRRNAIAVLEAGGGNNDAGGLRRAAELALRSRKRDRLLIMISDGLPTECTFESLKNLVRELTQRYGITCAQVAVDRIEQIAFPDYVDLSGYPTDEALSRFGRLLIRLTSQW